MAFLIPILLPQVIETVANIGLGITNAIEGDSSSVSFQVGKKVFSTKKKFNFSSLPPELRYRIILLALEESKSLILPPAFVRNPFEPMTHSQLEELRRSHPLNPENEHYRSIVGDHISANAYPISSWRWAAISTEWRDALRRALWRRLDVGGHYRYAGLLRRLSSEKEFLAMKLVKTITLRDGFTTPSDLYTILSNPLLENLEEISILPDYPTPQHQLQPLTPTFNFGLQLLRTPKPMKALTFGLPLEASTNSASRQHLKTLHPLRLSLTFCRPTVSLFKELEDLVGATTELLEIRYIPIQTFVGHQMFLSAPLQSFKHINLLLLLPRPVMKVIDANGQRTLVENPESQQALFVTSLISALEAEDEEVQQRYTVWRLEGWDIPGHVSRAAKTRIWPAEDLFNAGDFDVDQFEEESIGLKVGGEDSRELGWEVRTGGGSASGNKNGSGSGAGPKKHWERETNLNLLGGLINLRLESKKH